MIPGTWVNTISFDGSGKPTPVGERGLLLRRPRSATTSSITVVATAVAAVIRHLRHRVYLVHPLAGGEPRRAGRVRATGAAREVVVDVAPLVGPQLRRCQRRHSPLREPLELIVDRGLNARAGDGCACRGAEDEAAQEEDACAAGTCRHHHDGYAIPMLKC